MALLQQNGKKLRRAMRYMVFMALLFGACLIGYVAYMR